MIHKNICFMMAVILSVVAVSEKSIAQAKWRRSEPKIELKHRLFHSTKVIGLPTAETLGKGDFEFEISHRFQPPVTEGYEALYGFDGPVKMRLAVGYAVFDNCMVMLGRTNIDDNTDLELKYRILHPEKGSIPIMAAIQIGAAWNITETFRLNQQGDMIVRPKGHKRHFQYFSRLIVDFMPFSKLAIGLVPSYLYNSDINAKDIDDTFLLGTHCQLFLHRRWSLIGEWSFILSNKSNWHNPVGIGVELETGAHIFELFVTNQLRMNSTQYIAGADYPFDDDNLRIGFFINRIL
jgi:hypothetical protein